MSRKRITVVPQGGLCNRLRVVLSAFALSLRGADVCVEWEPLPECQACFDDLFLPLHLPTDASGRFVLHRRCWYNRPQTRANLHIPAFLRYAFYEAQYPNYTMQNGNLLNASAQRIYVSTGSVLGDYPEDWRQHLQLQPDVEAQVNTLVSRFAPRTVGIHIRRTDHRLAIQYSTDDAFCEAVRREIQVHPDTHFFLATDDAALKHRFQDQWGERIIVQHHAPLQRDTMTGIRAAVVDLWTLAATQKLLGSYWSSFTDTAAELGDIPVHIIGAPKP